MRSADSKCDGDGLDDDLSDPEYEAWFAAEYPITEQDRAEFAMMDHIPDHDEVRALMTRYFVGPITEEAVDYAYTEFLRAFEDDGSRSFYNDQFNSRFNGRGDAWREELSHKRERARPIDLVVLISQMESKIDPSRPQPRKYCPPEFVGTQGPSQRPRLANACAGNFWRMGRFVRTPRTRGPIESSGGSNATTTPAAPSSWATAESRRTGASWVASHRRTRSLASTWASTRTSRFGCCGLATRAPDA